MSRACSPPLKRERDTFPIILTYGIISNLCMPKTTSHFDFCSSVAQTKRDGQLKNTIFCYSTSHGTTFCTRYKILKDKNDHFNFPLFFSLPLSRLPLSMTRILNFFVTTIFYCNHYFHFLSCYFMILICSGHRAFNMI